jgi:hypothetical protein
MEHPSNKAWLTLGVAVAAYDYFAPEGETMSEAVDRAILKHPLITITTVGLVALHLLNVLPPTVDPIHQIANITRNERES